MSSSLHMVRRVPARPEEVFQAWTDPEILVEWWGAGESRLVGVEVDARPGGAYRFEVAYPDGGHRFEIAGTYLEIDPPHRLSFTWQFVHGGPDDSTSQVTVELTPDGEETELHLTHDRFVSDEAAAPYGRGWEATLPKLLALFAPG